jgi:hypothetical protein
VGRKVTKEEKKQYEKEKSKMRGCKNIKKMKRTITRRILEKIRNGRS